MRRERYAANSFSEEPFRIIKSNKNDAIHEAVCGWRRPKRSWRFCGALVLTSERDRLNGYKKRNLTPHLHWKLHLYRKNMHFSFETQINGIDNDRYSHVSS